MSGVLSFMDSPLVSWVSTFDSGDETLDFSELSEGVFLYDLFLQICDQDVVCDGDSDVKRKMVDPNSRLHNWSLLLTGLIHYYKDFLHQLVVMEMPDIVGLGSEPTKDGSIEAMRQVLLLLLGCAVQCEARARYISAIKTLDVAVQQDIVQLIQQVTDDPCVTIPVRHTDVTLSIAQLHQIIDSLASERTTLHQRVCSLSAECVYLRAEVQGHQGFVSPPESLQGYHREQDLTIARNKINSLTHSLEERSKRVCEVEEEVEQCHRDLRTLQDKNVELKENVRVASGYREEAEELRQQVSQISRLTQEIERQKNELSELEFYKSRVTELSEDHDYLLESQRHTEEQASRAHQRAESLMDELVRVQLQADEANTERERLSSQLRSMTEEKAVLEAQQAEVSRGHMRHYISSDSLAGSSLHLPLTSTPGNTMSEELKDSMGIKMAELESENEDLKTEVKQTTQRLAETEKQLAQLRADTDQELQRKVSEIELQTKELRKKTSRDLTREFEVRVTEIEERSLNLKKRIGEEFKQRLGQLETSNRMLQRRIEDGERKLEMSEQTTVECQQRLAECEEGWGNDRAQLTRVDNLARELIAEREQYKQRILQARHDTQNRVVYLERELSTLQARITQLQTQNVQLSETMMNSQAELGHYISIVAEADLNESRSRSESGPARIVYIPPTSTPHKQTNKKRNSFASSDSRRNKCESGRNPRQSPRPVSAISMDERAMSYPRVGSPHSHPIQRRASVHETPSSPSPHLCPRHAALHSPAAQRHSIAEHSSVNSSFDRNDRIRRSMPVRLDNRQMASPVPWERLSSTSSTASYASMPPPPSDRVPRPVFTRSQSFREGPTHHRPAGHQPGRPAHHSPSLAHRRRGEHYSQEDIHRRSPATHHPPDHYPPGSYAHNQPSGHNYPLGGNTHHQASNANHIPPDDLAHHPPPQGGPHHQRPDYQRAFSSPIPDDIHHHQQPARNRSHFGEERRRDSVSDQDSGCDYLENSLSPRHNNSSFQSSSSHDQSNISPRQSSHGYQVVTSQTVIQKTQVCTTVVPQEKMKMLVQRVVELQDKNQLLLVENTKMRRSLKVMEEASERIGLLEHQNLQLELENRKLKRMTQSNPQTPLRDRHTYHFYTNV